VAMYCFTYLQGVEEGAEQGHKSAVSIAG